MDNSFLGERTGLNTPFDVHLQWFTDEVEVDNEEETEVEFVPDDGEGGEGDVSVEDLQKQLSEVTAALTESNRLNEELRGQVNNTQAIVNGFEKAADKIISKPEPVVKQEQTEEDSEEVRQKWFDDPATSAEKLMKDLFEKKANTFQADLVRVHLSNSKGRVPEELKKLAEGYEDEVDQVIKATPPEVLIQFTDPYIEAYKKVIGTHVTEIMAKNKGGTDNNNNGKVNKPFTETGNVAPPETKKIKKVKLTQEMIDYADEMEKMGIDRNEALKRRYGYGR